ncbi:APC family permease (plasmid) [Streptomyces sp. NBC_01267]|uniref:APC family permease n=1 Tax=Streptomyces sp. NBC_01267 TaxID=2903805 RepID=UPI002E375BC9|nr:APC family permease [Streptomyces sp. NBC_01267]
MTITKPAARVADAAPRGADAPATARASLGTGHILFVIVAAAAPLSALIGTVPLSFAFGNGAGVPAAFAIAGIILLCFSVGYTVSAQRTGGNGGFYATVADGLGRVPAVGGGYLALFAYNCATIGIAGALGYFSQLVFAAHGIHVSWVLCAAVGVALTAFFGYRDITVSARLLALLMVGEIGVLVVLDAAILWRHGVHALPAASFSPSTVSGHGIGVSLMFAFVSFIGFESAALYGGEARNPRRSIPRAMYGAVLLITGFYALTSWLAVGAVGSSHVREQALSQMGNLFFGLGDSYLGSAGGTVLQVMLCTSMFAALLALHSATNRYTKALAADRLVPVRLDALHRRYGSPHRASVVQTALNVVAVAAAAAAGLDPYADFASVALGLGTLGIVVLQALAALSVVTLRRKSTVRVGWRGTVASLLALVGLGGSVWLIVRNFDLITGSKSSFVGELPLLLPVVFLVGLAYAWRTGRGLPSDSFDR